MQAKRFPLQSAGYHFRDKSSELQALYDCSDFIHIIDLMVDQSFYKKFHYYESTQIMKAFIFVPEDIATKSDEWVKHYILINNKDTEKMECIFNVISELSDEKKIEYICYLINLNDDPELFKRIPLIPTSFSWSGSEVPIYSGWIDYLKKLLPIFSGIRFLYHKQIIKEKIDILAEWIERAEIEDILMG